MASLSSWTTSWPSTPLHLNPFVQEMRVLWEQKTELFFFFYLWLSQELQSLSTHWPRHAPPHPVQACLVTRKREIEPKLQIPILQGVCIQEFRQAVGSKVKELREQGDPLTLTT